MNPIPGSTGQDRESLGLPNGVALVASTFEAGWGEIHGLVVEGRLAEPYQHFASSTVVAFLLNGPTQVEWKRGPRFTRFFSEPGSLTIIPAGTESEFRTDRDCRALLWAIDPKRIQALADCELKPPRPKVEIREAFNNRDPELWSLGQKLAERICSPIPGSRLYAESLGVQIAVQLLWNHSSLDRTEPAGADRLRDGRFQRVIDYIQSSLGNEVSLGELADLAGLSPNYFLSAFRQATGKTPHHYLTEQRIARACELLQNPHHSLVEVSLAVGFSSQSHLTTVFRRFMKTTPAAYREDVLGRRTVVDLDGGIEEPERDAENRKKRAGSARIS